MIFLFVLFHSIISLVTSIHKFVHASSSCFFLYLSTFVEVHHILNLLFHLKLSSNSNYCNLSFYLEILSQFNFDAVFSWSHIFIKLIFFQFVIYPDIIPLKILEIQMVSPTKLLSLFYLVEKCYTLLFLGKLDENTMFYYANHCPSLICRKTKFITVITKLVFLYLNISNATLFYTYVSFSLC